jgi:tetraacyldisaccharide 4'-kinase
MSALSAVYGGVARVRRSWYEGRPQSRVRLSRPVVSVGNMVVGGSGKTPIVAALAATLSRLGHRPAILSRGYGRTKRHDEVVVVSDGTRALVPVEESGDEPQMLAREVEGVPIVVASDRARAGQVAIDRFDATVLVLDDGFQHLRLERTVDLLVLSSTDLTEKVLPAGRLREPLAAARSADAVLVYGDAEEAQRIAAAVHVSRFFTVHTRYRPLRRLQQSGPEPSACSRVAAVAGIARPQRFFDALRRQRFDVVRELTFPDHHWFTAADLEGIERYARQAGAEAIVTTSKDAVRVERYITDATLPWGELPLDVSIEPVAGFDAWLRHEL